MSQLAPPLNAENYLDVLKLQKPPAEFIPFYKNLLNHADKNLAKSFLDNTEVANLVRTRGWCVEQVIMQLWQQFTTTDKLALVAVGGFGRGDLHPYSDVDLLILKPRISQVYDAQISEFIQALWDIGLDVGSSVRTSKECFEQAQGDVTVATNLMEARFILGNKKLFKQMEKLVTAKKIWKGEDFFIAKWNEQKLRHKKFSDTTYNVEPNIKEGPGGLRDIQMVSWVVQRFFYANSLHELVDAGFLTEHEYIRLKKGQNFLWKVRYALHIIAKRKEDRVLFDYQLKLAKIFGFNDEGIKNPAVEQFMQVFYRNAMRLERLNSRLLQLFDEKILKKNHKNAVAQINKRFHIVNDFLEIKDISLFQSKSSVWFELFLLIQKHPDIQGVRADTVRAMRHNINCINDDFRNNSIIKKQFLEILQQDEKVASVLNQMNQLGILARYLPVFGKIVGRMQFDLFHIYTVDQHSLFAVRNLCLLRHSDTEVIGAKQIFNNLPKPYLVYVAALFHDIAKGREGRHADLGAIDAQEFCQQHNIDDEDSKLVIWLVKYHLIMSETAQKRDLSDPQVIEKFAQCVDSLLKLRALYLLTVADISATDPKLWNSFKQSLIYELFLKTKQHLTANKQNLSADSIKNTLVSELTLKNIPELAIQQQINDFPKGLYLQFSPEKLLKIHQLIATNATPLAACLSNNGNSIEFIIYCQDFKGLFYIMVSILEKYNFTVVDANINNTQNNMANNMAINTVYCLIQEQKPATELMLKELTDALKLRKFYDISINKYTSLREKVFKIKPKVKILQSNKTHDSLIEVICWDRHGLLPLIAKALLSLGISINAAKIVTVGTRAEFTYWLSINQKPLNTKQLKTLQEILLEKL